MTLDDEIREAERAFRLDDTQENHNRVRRLRCKSNGHSYILMSTDKTMVCERCDDTQTARFTIKAVEHVISRQARFTHYVILDWKRMVALPWGTSFNLAQAKASGWNANGIDGYDTCNDSWTPFTA